jgi:hypothetical protein
MLNVRTEVGAGKCLGNCEPRFDCIPQPETGHTGWTRSQLSPTRLLGVTEILRRFVCLL